MFHPRYSLTPRLLTNLTAIERLYGQLEGLRLPQNLMLNLRRDNLVQSTYFSNKIEGNQLSLYEVTNLLTNKRTPVSRDEKEVTRYFDLLQKLENYTNTPISLKLITDFHYQLFFTIHDYAGDIRNEIVAVGRYQGQKGAEAFKIKHLPPFHAQSEIKEALTELVAWLKLHADLPPVIKAGLFHHQFLYLHPFEDGNGRVARSLTALIFIQAGYRINRHFVLDDYYDFDRTAYSDALHSADNHLKTEWLEYFSDGVKYSLNSALTKAQNALRTLNFHDRPTPKEKAVLQLMTNQPEITSSEVTKLLGVSRQQAHHLLSALVAKGLAEKLGSTKASFYRLK